MNTNIKGRVEELLDDITQNEYKELFSGIQSNNEKLQLLTSESLLALYFVTSIEDEFAIEFNDDEVDMDFFNEIESVVIKIEKQLNKKAV